jgi:hypothetical protein
MPDPSFQREQVVPRLELDLARSKWSNPRVTQIAGAVATYSVADHLAKGSATAERIATLEGMVMFTAAYDAEWGRPLDRYQTFTAPAYAGV